ncbi:MAG: arsenosugar biosynthesis radical SAM protein ArsS [Candidatus Erginobacter occultus]|nr:arsenosugar biosynthesis radical SAM protein ArsS [Candidatus Erginobacter occultus]
MIETAFRERAAGHLKRDRLRILQVNLGNLCNQSCLQCHVDGSPSGDRNMSSRTVEEVLSFLRSAGELTLDITGGAPELNPNFRRLVRAARPPAGMVMVRSNLTVLLEPGQEDLVEFLADQGVKIVASLPCYTRANVDGQRGSGTFEKSIRVLKLLNRAGYGRREDLEIDLVYNPGGAFLPGAEADLERDYRAELAGDHGVVFNRLITIANAPIGRFGRRLNEEGELERYLVLLEENFNPSTLPRLMCRTLLSVDYRGFLYDCDFNQAQGMVLKDETGRPLHISTVTADDLSGREISTGNHCFSCAAGAGSSCGGTLL